MRPVSLLVEHLDVEAGVECGARRLLAIGHVPCGEAVAGDGV